MKNNRFVALFIGVFTILCCCSFNALADIYMDYKYEIREDGTACIIEYTGFDSEVVIPSILGGYTVTEIGDNAFDASIYLSSIIIPLTRSFLY